MSPTIATTGLPPIEWPRVTIGGKTYTVKYSQLSEYMISKWGYQLSDLAQLLKVKDPKDESPDDPRRFSYVIQLWAACVAHEFPPPQVAPTPEQWMQLFPDEDSAIFGEVGKAVMVALVKRLSERAKKAGLTPTAEAAPAPTPIQ